MHKGNFKVNNKKSVIKCKNRLKNKRGNIWRFAIKIIRLVRYWNIACKWCKRSWASLISIFEQNLTISGSKWTLHGITRKLKSIHYSVI